MISDYHRYNAETATEGKLTETTENASKYYQQATEAVISLKPCNSNKLNLILNYYVFYFELENDSANACKIVEKTLNDVGDEIDKKDKEETRDNLSIITFSKRILISGMNKEKLTIRVFKIFK